MKISANLDHNVPPPPHRGQRTKISHSETVGREGGTRFLEPNLAFAYFDIISSF